MIRLKFQRERERGEKCIRRFKRRGKWELGMLSFSFFLDEREWRE